MNGSIRVVVDTNVYFIFFYNPASKSGKLIEAAIGRKVDLFSTDTVQEELKRVLVRELSFEAEKAENVIVHLPVTWVGREVYQNYLDKAKVVQHKPDRPILALALTLNCGIITANIRDFKPARKIVKIWKIDDLLEELGKQ